MVKRDLKGIINDKTMKTMSTIKSIIDGCTPKIKTFWIVITLLSMSITIAMTSVMQYSSATPAASATTVTIAKGAQNSNNKEFYVPPQTTAKPGSTITWNNEDSAIHTATSGRDATPDGKFDTSLISPGQSSKSITMPNEPGEYSYFCTLHPWMIGTVEVQ
jgi:plastocyanin